MAKEDDDWNNFLNSIDDPDEEVETSEDEDENLADDDQGTDKKPPKKSKEAPKGDEDADADDSDDDDSDKDDDADDADAGKDSKKGKDADADTYKPRLKQFINDDGSVDIQKLETAHIESSKEGVRLNTVLEETNEKYNRLLDAIKAKPEAAKLLFGEEGAKDLAKGKPEGQQLDPFSRHVKAQIDKQSKQDYTDFVDAHPEAVSDPEKARQIGVFLKRFGRDYPDDNDGELPTMKQGLEAAYRWYGWDLGTTKEEDIAVATKKTAATRSTPNKKTPVTKQKKNELEGFFAKKLGVKIK